jgi:hypothetical protein
MLMLGLFSAPPEDGGTLLLDASDATSCTITRNEHGDEQLTAQIARPLAETMRLFDQPGLLWVGLYGDGRCIWGGRLEDPGLFAKPDGSGMVIKAFGSWRALSDTPIIMLWSTTNVADFLATTGAMGSAYDQSERWTRDTNNRLLVALTKGNTYTLNKAAGLLFVMPHRGGRSIVGLQFEIAITLPTQMTLRVVGFDEPSPPGGALTNGVVYTTFVGTGALVNRAYHLNLSGSPRQVVGLDLLCNTGFTYAGETAAQAIIATKVRVVTSITNRVNTTLTANRAAGASVTATVAATAGMYVGMELVINSGATSSEIVTVESITSATQFVATFAFSYTSGQTVQGHRILADEIVSYTVGIVAGLNSAQLSASTALIQSPGLDLLDEDYVDAPIGDVLTHLASLGDTQTPPRQWEVGVNRERLLYFRPQGYAARAWYVDATELDVLRSLEELYNAVFVTYQDASGRRLLSAAAVDTASITRYGVRRQAIISADTTSTTQANVQRDAYLQDHKDPLPQASFVFDTVYDASGGRYQLSDVEPGDTITIRNVPVNASATLDRVRTFRITHTSYDPIARTLAVEPEAPIPTLETMLTRQAEGL